MRNLQQAGLSERAEAMRLSTLEAAARISDAVSLLFVDADHEYESIREDLQAWSPRVIEEGLIVLHDFGAWPGPTRAAADLLDAGYRRHAQSGTSLALRKAAPRQ